MLFTQNRRKRLITRRERRQQVKARNDLILALLDAAITGIAFVLCLVSGYVVLVLISFSTGG
jgi:hypothetical protein